jgi:hypothetical protein
LGLTCRDVPEISGFRVICLNVRKRKAKHANKGATLVDLRYYAIAAPLHYTALVSPRRVALGLGISWTGMLLLCLPPFSGLVPPYRYVPGLGCCAPDFGNDGWGTAGSLYGAAYALLGLALPALLVTICNLRVLGIARYHRHRIASAIYEVTLSAQVTITHQRNPFFVPTVTAPAAGGPPKFHSAASTVSSLSSNLQPFFLSFFIHGSTEPTMPTSFAFLTSLVSSQRLSYFITP